MLLQNTYNPSWHHKLIAEKLEAVERGEIKRLMLFIPPRHGKSELATIKFPSWYLGRNSDKSLISVSYNQELATDFGRKVRNTMQHELYQAVFPKAKMNQDSTAVNRFHVSERGQYIATGIGGSITGRGGHLVIIDDPVKNREDADSETYQKKCLEWYSSTLYTRLEEDAAVVLIMTRWHQSDLAGKLLEQMQEGGDQWEIVDLPAIAIKDEEHREVGAPLWPDKYPLEELERIQKAISKRDWSCLYQQQPISPESQEFHEEWFRYFDELPDDMENMQILTVVDPAFKKNQESDYSVVLTAGKVDDRMYILDYTRGKYDPSELIDKIVYHIKKWKPHKVGVEAYSAQSVIGFYLQERLQEEALSTSYDEIVQKGTKEQKIRRLIPFFRNGKLFHKKWMSDMEQELLTFPVGKHDDIIDAMQMALEFKVVTTLSKREEDIEYFRDLGISYNSYGEPVYK